MSSRMTRIHADILHELGHPKDVNEALRVRLGLPARLIKTKPKTKVMLKPRISFDDMPMGEQAAFPHDEYKFKSIQRTIQRKNRQGIHFAFWMDNNNTYVMRLK